MDALIGHKFDGRFTIVAEPCPNDNSRQICFNVLGTLDSARSNILRES